MVILAMSSILCGNVEMVRLSLSVIQQNPSNQREYGKYQRTGKAFSKAVGSEGYLYVHPFGALPPEKCNKSGRCRALSGRIGENRF